MAAPVQAREYSPVDITSHDFWDQPFAVRDETFVQLRAADGLSWHHPLPSMFPMEEPGFLGSDAASTPSCSPLPTVSR